jgi:DNA-binding beta-propeller fold protein YncE
MLFAQEKQHIIVNYVEKEDYSIKEMEIPLSGIRHITFSELGDRMYVTNNDNSSIEIGEEVFNEMFDLKIYAQMTFAMRITNSIASVQNSSIKIYPNPATNILYIEGIEENCTLSVYSRDGKQISIPAVKDANSYQLSISLLTTGIYFLEINNQFYKFIKK